MAGMDLVLFDRNGISREKVTGLSVSEFQIVPEVGDQTEYKGKGYVVTLRHIPMVGFGQVITLFLKEIG